MTTEVELLPLPEGEASSFGNYEVHDNEAMVEYARANVAHAVAPLQAEIERLQAEIERLAMALRLAEEYINDLTPEWYSAGQRVLAEIRAVLSEGNSND